MPATKSTNRKTAAGRTKDKIWSDEERAAMQDSVRERKTAPRPGSPAERAEGERDVLEKIATMPEPDRSMAERIHELVTTTAPAFVPRTFYGMPAYSLNGKVICFFQAKSKFKVRYATFGFQHDARIDDGEMWPVSFALTELTPKAEARIVELVKRAAG
jgi:uncharacterized protein YdhG (YjbR/CyaY superfamily)